MKDYRIDFVDSLDRRVGSISFTGTPKEASDRIRATNGAFLRRRFYCQGQPMLGEPLNWSAGD